MEWVPDLRQIRAFVAVAEEGSFTLAAKKIFVTQSAVSHALRTLEQQLSCILLDRSGKGICLTECGEVLIKRCRKILAEIDQAARDLDSLRRWGQTRIRIGATHSICFYLLPSVIREFRDCFPRCETLIEAGDTASLEEKLARGQLDLVLGIKTKAHQESNFRFMASEELCFVVSKCHSWCENPKSIGESLAKQQYIQYAKGTETNRLVQTWLENEVGAVTQPIVLGDMKAICEMARLGIGVGIVAPWVAAREMEQGGLHQVAIPGTGIPREWAAFYSTKKQPSLVEEAFIGMCTLGFKNLMLVNHVF